MASLASGISLSCFLHCFLLFSLTYFVRICMYAAPTWCTFLCRLTVGFIKENHRHNPLNSQAPMTLEWKNILIQGRTRTINTTIHITACCCTCKRAITCAEFINSWFYRSREVAVRGRIKIYREAGEYGLRVNLNEEFFSVFSRNFGIFL